MLYRSENNQIVVLLNDRIVRLRSWVLFHVEVGLMVIVWTIHSCAAAVLTHTDC